jgi:hypothetical protein
MLIPSCTPQYGKPKYINKYTHKHKKIMIIKQGTYLNPSIKKEAKQKLIKPKTINLNDF